MASQSLAENGYEMYPEVLSQSECDRVRAAIASWNGPKSRAGARHLLACPAVERVANDERLLRLVFDCFSEAGLPYRVTLFEKSMAASWLVPWHQDTALPLSAKFDSPEWGPWSVKAGVNYAHAPAWALERIVALRVHLDDSNAANGPLQVIPGSHRAGVLSDDEIESVRELQPGVACLVAQGGVLAMRPLLLHASSKPHSAAPRPVLHIEYAPRGGLGAPMALAMA